MKRIIKTMKISTVRFISKFEISKYCSDQHSRIFCNLMNFNKIQKLINKLMNEKNL
jgi:hypothetical protein